MKKNLLVIFAFVACSFLQPLFAQADSWAPFQALSGNCSLAFPQLPEHLVNKMPIPNSEDSIYYHIYLSSPHDGNGVYLLVVAKYPAPMEKEQELLCLEGFLSGIIQQNPDNELISAEMTDISGHQAVDFFIKSSEKAFKGRTLVANDTLYLIAVENALANFQQDSFEKFVSSFALQP